MKDILLTYSENFEPIPLQKYTLNHLETTADSVEIHGEPDDSEITLLFAANDDNRITDLMTHITNLIVSGVNVTIEVFDTELINEGE